MDDDTVLRFDEDSLTWREVDGEIVALDLASSTYFAANASALVLWEHLAKGCTRGDLVGALVAAYGLDDEQAAGHVDDFLAACREAGLLDDA